MVAMDLSRAASSGKRQLIEPPGPVSAYRTTPLSTAANGPMLEVPVISVIVTSYEGETNVSGLYHGNGSAHFVDGHTYTGEWAEGYMHGTGRYVWVDGPMYEGDFVMNNISGKGSYTWPGSGVYTGDVLNGKRHGEGSISFELDEAVYNGMWVHGLREGFGKLTFNKEGTCFYEGDWKKDCKTGQGRMVYANGNEYQGAFYKDKKNGYGTMVWAQTGEKYTGNWTDGLPQGLGEHVWYGSSLVPMRSNHAQFLMHNRYVGQFVKGRREGEGTFFYSTGARYEGRWLNNKKQGEGIFIFEDGTVFVGSFENDRPLNVPSEKFGPEDAGPKVYVDDLLAEEPDSEDAYRAVLKLLLCHNSDLRSIYDKYCAVSVPEVEAQGISGTGSAMMSGQVWKIIKDCKLYSKHLSFASCCEAVLRACQAPAAITKRRAKHARSKAVAVYLASDPFYAFDPTYIVMYREFCEALVRIAQLKYHAFPKLERRLHKLINDDVLPNLLKKCSQKPKLQSSPSLTSVKSFKSFKSSKSMRYDRTPNSEAEPAVPPPKTVADQLAEPKSLEHLGKLSVVTRLLFSIAEEGTLENYMHVEELRAAAEQNKQTNSWKHISSFRGKSARIDLTPESRDVCLQNTLTFRSCLRLLHDIEMLEGPGDKPAPELTEDSNGEAGELVASQTPQMQASKTPEDESRPTTAATDSRPGTADDWQPPPAKVVKHTMTMEAAYAALLKAVLPPADPLTSEPPLPVDPLSPPRTPPPGTDPFQEELAKETPVVTIPEEAVDIWMMDYKVTYSQFIEWLATIAGRLDTSERYPLFVKLNQYLKAVVQKALMPLEIMKAEPDFTTDGEVRELLALARQQEIDAARELFLVETAAAAAAAAEAVALEAEDSNLTQ